MNKEQTRRVSFVCKLRESRLVAYYFWIHICNNAVVPILLTSFNRLFPSNPRPDMNILQDNTHRDHDPKWGACQAGISELDQLSSYDGARNSPTEFNLSSFKKKIQPNVIWEKWAS